MGAESGIGPEWLWSPPLIGESGIDLPVTGTVVVAIVAGIAGVAALRRLRVVTTEST